jgi:putative transcriptional regulator
MSKLRSRLKILMAEKSVQEKRRITLAVVAEETELSRPTIFKLSKDEISQIRGEVIVKVCEYFECSVGDLLYIGE